MNAALQAVGMSDNPRQGFSVKRGALAGIVVLVIAAVVTGWVMLRRPSMAGRFTGTDGTSVLEFRGSRVYVTTSLGTTFVASYEVDGHRVIIRGAGGAQVYTREGDTLEGGVGIRFVKHE